jgi:hypothetical protein
MLSLVYFSHVHCYEVIPVGAPAAKTSTGFIHMASLAAIQMFYGFCGSLENDCICCNFRYMLVALQKCDAVLSDIS